MKFSGKAILMTFAMVLTVAFMNAQPQGKGGERGGNIEERVEKETTRLQKKLGLSDSQTAKVSAINLTYAQKLKTMRDAARAEKEAGNDIDREDMRAQMNTLRDAQTAEIKAILTPEQVSTFNTMLEEQKGKKRKKGKKGKKSKAEEGEETDN